MAGISSKAARVLENKKKYNGIEFDEDLDIDSYEAFYRNLDPQTGRWWQIDPQCEPKDDPDEPGLESLSPYNSMANDPVKLSDPLGDWPEWLEGVAQSVLGAVNAYTSDNIGGIGRVDGSNLTSAFQIGQKIGDVAAIVTGVIEDVIAGGGEVATLGGATPIAVPLAIHGTATIATAAKNLFSDITYQTYTKPAKDGGAPYSGKTSGKGTPEQNIAKRDKNHHMNDKHGPAELDKSSKSKNAIRGREQQLIEKSGGAKSQKGTSGNQNNGIAPKNPKKAKYIKAANKEFGTK